MNEYDSNRILDLVKPIGYLPTKNISEADCYILNTCHIREKATEKVYHDIGRVKKEFRNKKKPIVLVTGCVAQAENEEMLNREKYINAVVGPQSYHQISSILNRIEKTEESHYSGLQETHEQSWSRKLDHCEAPEAGRCSHDGFGYLSRKTPKP